MSESKKSFIINSIKDKSATVAVVGMGYVGYPMAALVASAGFKVLGLDIDEQRINLINKGVSYIKDIPSDAVAPLIENGMLTATTDYADLKTADVIMICVPTPLNKTGDPDMTFVISSLETLLPNLTSGALIILESTTYPGTTEEIFVPAVKERGFEVGKDVFVAFSPERIDPGNPEYGPKNTPKVVGGVTSACTEVAMSFYSEVIDTVIPVSSTTAAEMVKLYENTFRAINIGLVNELAIICDLLKVDVWEIIEAADSKPFGFMKFLPGPGLGGHCIPVDPGYLAWKMRALRYKTRFIELATEINTAMPEWTVKRISSELNQHKKSINGSKILILGLAYKNDIDDLRESPALDVFALLKGRGAEVVYHDPYCKSAMIEGQKEYSMELSDELLSSCDMVVITTGHKIIDYNYILSKSKLIFDTRNVTNGLEHPESTRVVRL